MKLLSPLFKASVLLASLLLINGCALFEVKLDTKTTPLSQTELNSRIVTRAFVRDFANSIDKQSVPSQYAQQNDSLSGLLLWKIASIEQLQAFAYQTRSEAAVLDTMGFLIASEDYFNRNRNTYVFSESALAFIGEEKQKYLTKVQSLWGAAKFNKALDFLNDRISAEGFDSLDFNMTSHYQAWLEAQGIDESQQVTNLGTMPEALSDVADKLSVTSEQTPKLIAYRAELIALNSDVSAKDIEQTLASINATSEALNKLIDQNPETFRKLTKQLAADISPLVDKLDAKAQARIEQLDVQRQQLEFMVAKERKILLEFLAVERIKMQQDLDTMRKQAIDQASDKLIEIIQASILYFIAFILVVFFAPLYLGYRMGRRKNTDN